jgi:large subunit ribosomal protein L31
MWWVREIFQKNIYHRPKLIEISQTVNIEFSGIFVTNSPSFHIVPTDVANVYMHDFEIYADMFGILDLWKLFGDRYGKVFENVHGMHFELPTFPLNPNSHKITVQMTDGTEFETMSTWGKEGDVMKLDIDPKSHPAWTGVTQKLQDKGRVSKFNKRFANLQKA